VSEFSEFVELSGWIGTLLCEVINKIKFDIISKTTIRYLSTFIQNTFR
jgi:hypothetical protein